MAFFRNLRRFHHNPAKILSGNRGQALSGLMDLSTKARSILDLTTFQTADRVVITHLQEAGHQLTIAALDAKLSEKQSPESTEETKIWYRCFAADCETVAGAIIAREEDINLVASLKLSWPQLSENLPTSVVATQYLDLTAQIVETWETNTNATPLMRENARNRAILVRNLIQQVRDAPHHNRSDTPVHKTYEFMGEIYSIRYDEAAARPFYTIEDDTVSGPEVFTYHLRVPPGVF